MMQAVIIQRIDQGALHMFLPDQFLEILWPPLTRQNLITQD
jgi:hypothetical protein